VGTGHGRPTLQQFGNSGSESRLFAGELRELRHATLRLGEGGAYRLSVNLAYASALSTPSL